MCDGHGRRSLTPSNKLKWTRSTRARRRGRPTRSWRDLSLLLSVPIDASSFHETIAGSEAWSRRAGTATTRYDSFRCLWQSGLGHYSPSRSPGHFAMATIIPLLKRKQTCCNRIPNPHLVWCPCRKMLEGGTSKGQRRR